MAAASSARETRSSAGSKVLDSSNGFDAVVTLKANELEARDGGFGEGLRQSIAMKVKIRVTKMKAATAAISASRGASMDRQRQDSRD